jgi:hypothetical protein
LNIIILLKAKVLISLKQWNKKKFIVVLIVNVTSSWKSYGKKTTQQQKNKLSSIPAGHFYISKFEAHTESCILQRKTSTKFLASLPAFQQAVAASIEDSTL